MNRLKLQADAMHSLPFEVLASQEVFALPGVFSLVEQASLPALSVALQYPDLFDEVAILERLAYKNKNQHRASKHHQAVCQVLKVFQLFQHLQLPAHLQALHIAAERTALPEASATAGSTKRARRQQSTAAAAQRQAVRLPSFQAGCFVLRRLLSGVQLLLDLHPVILAAAQHLSGQLSRGYFMPFCLVAAAAASRIRVLATTALLELLQAYNSLVQLLPLLPAVAAAECGSNGVLLISSDSLPQMLQLAWNGPIPALRSIPFEPQGPQSLQGLAAELQQTFSISSSSSGNGSAAGLQVAAGPGALQQQGAQHHVGADAAGVLQGGSGGVGDVGVAISREAFLQQLGQQQHPQQQQPEKGRQRPQRQTRSRSQQQQQQQQQQAPIVAISFFEDKQPQPGAAAAVGSDTDMQQAAAAVPLYTTVPGLGFSLGQQQHNPGPTLPVLLGVAPPANTSADQAAGQAGRADWTQHTGAMQTPAATGTAGAQAMEIDTFAAEDREEFAQLYGKQPTPTQPKQQQRYQRQQQHQQEQRPTGQASTVGQPAVAAARSGAVVRRSLQAPAAFLAMQGPNSSDDEDMQPVTLQPAAAAAVPAAQQALPVPWLAIQRAGSEWPGQQQQQQQQATLGAPVQVAAAVPIVSQAQQQAVEASTAGLAAAAAAAQSSQVAQGVPVLQAAKRGKQKKRGKQQKSGSKPDSDSEPAPRDNILNMLLQGL